MPPEFRPLPLLQDRANKCASELERTKKSLAAKSDRVRQLEADTDAHRAANIGGMASELGGVRQALEESQRAVESLEEERNNIRRELEEVI